MKRFEVVGINDETDFCECCGKTGLKRVVWIHDTKNDETKHFGTTCAMQPAKGFDLTDEIKTAIKQHDTLQSKRLQSAIQQYKDEGGQYIGNANGSWSVADREHMLVCLKAWQNRMFETNTAPPVPPVAVAVIISPPAAPVKDGKRAVLSERKKQVNRERRKKLETIRAALDDAKDAIENAKNELDDVKTEEDEARENSVVKSGASVEASEQASDNMDAANDQLDSVIEALETAIAGLDEAEGTISEAAA